MTLKRLFLIPAALLAFGALCVLGSAIVGPSGVDAQPAGAMVYSKAAHDMGSLVDAAGETVVVTAPGAILGDFCVASVGVDVVDMLVTCNIQAAGLAEVRVQNESGSTADLAATTVRVMVFPRGTR